MNDNEIDRFPANSWVNIKLGGRQYMGRAICNERAHLVSTVDDLGKTVTFSWPFICANATEVSVIDINEAVNK